MTRKLAVVWAAEDTAAALHARYRAEAVIEVRTRLHALWLLRRGEPPVAVAAAVGVGLRSVHRWLQWYREGGLVKGIRTYVLGPQCRKSGLHEGPTACPRPLSVFGSARQT